MLFYLIANISVRGQMLMDTKPHRAVAHRQAKFRRMRQEGGALVELALYLFPLMVVLFLIIDMSFRAFDEGLLAHATRTAVRQGSLYWIDPNQYSIYVPRRNPRIKESMILSPLSYYSPNLINPGDSAVQKTVTVADEDTGNPLPSLGSSPNRIWVTDPNDSTLSVGDADVRVDVVYDHQSIGLGWWLGITGNDMSIHTGSELSTETRY